MWGGLHKGLQVLTENLILGRNASVLFFTDGVPNIRPPRQESEMLKRFNQQNNTSFSIHFFGFGYSMESQLLKDCAKYGGGSYCFIPDGSIVGTIFTNAVANILSTCADRIQLQTPGRICGGYQEYDGWTDLGPIMYGQTRDVILDCTSSVDLKVKYYSFGKPIEVTLTLEKSYVAEPTPEFNKELARLSLIKVIQTCMLNPLGATVAIKATADQMNLNPQGTEYLKDLSGQILEAFTGSGLFQQVG